MKLLRCLLILLVVPFLVAGCKSSTTLNDKPNFSLVGLPTTAKREASKGVIKLPKTDTNAQDLITKLRKSELNKQAALVAAIKQIEKHNTKPKRKE